jgi:tRNA threonylcarbamoyladenosine biosynthesis protein TsaE
MGAQPRTHLTRSEEETERIARDLGAKLGVGAVVLLYGDLGAGKTCFVRGLASGLGIDPEEVSSPTFTLVQEYRGRVPLYHVDLYRITPGEAGELGLEELTASGVVAIEWAEKVDEMFPSGIAVRIEDRGEEAREVRIGSLQL